MPAHVCMCVSVLYYLNNWLLEQESQEHKITGEMFRLDCQNEPKESLDQIADV